MEIYHKNRDLHNKKRLANSFYSNMQVKSRYLQFCIKRNIRNADEQKYISQMSAIDVYVYVKHLKLKLDNWYYWKISY